MLNLKRFNPIDLLIDLSVSFLFGKVVSNKNCYKISSGVGASVFMMHKGGKTYVVKIRKYKKFKKQ